MATIFTLRRAFLALLLSLAASAAYAGNRNGGVSLHDGNDPQRCGDITISIDGSPAQRAEERIVLPVDASRPLRVRAAENSGIRVRGADRRDFGILACKAAATQEDLSRISLSHGGDTVTVEGPSGVDWVGFLIILAPSDAEIELEAVNGPIGLSGLSGRVTARSENGPISVRDSPGEIDAKAENGPIHFTGGGGHLHLRTENGPIGVSLSGAAWMGVGLDARAINGPVQLQIPANYRSGAVVESAGRSPVHCRAEACAGARRSWDDDQKRIEFGEGPALVRLSTENGPVSVTSGNGESDEDGN